MGKKGAFSILGLRVSYFILAIIIVFFIYNFLDAKTGETINLGYASREMGLNLDSVYNAPGGKVIINERFKEPLFFNIEKGDIEVKAPSSNRSLNYYYVGDGFYDDLDFENDKEIKVVKIVKDDKGVMING